MATIKLGSLTLGNIALGSSTIADARKLSKTNAFRAQSLANHTEGKSVTNILPQPTSNSNPNFGIGGNVDNGSDWLLANSVWNDNGVWDDTQNWTE